MPFEITLPKIENSILKFNIYSNQKKSHSTITDSKSGTHEEQGNCRVIPRMMSFESIEQENLNKTNTILQKLNELSAKCDEVNAKCDELNAKCDEVYANLTAKCDEINTKLDTVLTILRTLVQ
jgi:uncharacterized coiled-coil DUF342 family protein